MESKSMSGKRGIATYHLDSDGSVYLVSLVTQGNWVDRYANKYFSSESELKKWLSE